MKKKKKKQIPDNNIQIKQDGILLTKKEPGKKMTPNFPVYLSSIKFYKCPFCNVDLKKIEIDVPVDTVYTYTCEAYKCSKHYFITPEPDLMKLINNKCTLMIDFRFDYYFKNYDMVNEIFYSNQNHYLMLLLKNKDSDKTIIISNYTDKSNENLIVLDYKDLETRKFLTILIKHNKKAIKIGTDIYDLVFVFDRGGIQKEVTFYYVISEKLQIKDGGGYSNKIRTRHQEIKELLLYSPYNDCYEFIDVTYDKLKNIYYADFSKYKNFYLEYGNPKIKIDAGDNDSSLSSNMSNKNMSLNSKSIPNLFGYNLSDKLDDTKRQEILKDVLDLELMTKKELIKLLNSNISLRCNKECYNADCRKWAIDIEFIEKYTVNLDRFLKREIK